jgi:hypothetical protein
MSAAYEVAVAGSLGAAAAIRDPFPQAAAAPSTADATNCAQAAAGGAAIRMRASAGHSDRCGGRGPTASSAG